MEMSLQLNFGNTGSVNYERLLPQLTMNFFMILKNGENNVTGENRFSNPRPRTAVEEIIFMSNAYGIFLWWRISDYSWGLQNIGMLALPDLFMNPLRPAQNYGYLIDGRWISWKERFDILFEFNLTHLPLVPHICVGEMDEHWFR